MSGNSFAGFDLSYWKTKDKTWVAEREQAWQQVEILLQGLSQQISGVRVIDLAVSC